MPNEPETSSVPRASHIQSYIPIPQDGNNVLHLLLRVWYKGIKDVYQRRYPGDFACQVETLTTLMQGGVSVTDLNAEGMTVLHAAIVLRAPVAIVRSILRHCPDVEAVDCNGQTALTLACTYLIHDTMDIVRALIKRGANIHHRDKQGRTALHFAAGSHADRPTFRHGRGTVLKRQTVQLVQLLLEAGANPNAVDGNGCVPLMFAFQTGEAFIHSSMLVNDGIYPHNDTCDYFGDVTCEVVRVLIKAGAKVDMVDGMKLNVLDGMLECVTRLAALDIRRDGKRSFYTHTTEGEYGCVKFLIVLQQLIEIGATSSRLNAYIQELRDFESPYGKSTLELRIAKMRCEVIEILMGIDGALLNVNTIDDDGLTDALTVTAQYGLPKLFFALWHEAKHREGFMDKLLNEYQSECQGFLDGMKSMADKEEWEEYEEEEEWQAVMDEGLLCDISSILIGNGPICAVKAIYDLLQINTSPGDSRLEAHREASLSILECAISVGMVPLQHHIYGILHHCFNFTATQHTAEGQHMCKYACKPSMLSFVEKLYHMIPEGALIVPMRQSWNGEPTALGLVTKQAVFSQVPVILSEAGAVFVDDMYELVTVARPTMWTPQAHHQFPQAFKDAVVTLMLCRCRDSDSKRATIGLLDLDLLFKIVKCMAYPLSLWLDV